MRTPELVISAEATPGEVQYLKDRLYEFNVAATGITDGVWLAILVRDDDHRIVAGICGNTWGGCAEIRQFWVEEARRKQRLGTRLLGAAEQEARRRGCWQMLLMPSVSRLRLSMPDTDSKSSRWWTTTRTVTRTCSCASALTQPASPAVNQTGRLQVATSCSWGMRPLRRGALQQFPCTPWHNSTVRSWIVWEHGDVFE